MLFDNLKKKSETENNKFGDKNYQMKDMYDANDLVVASFERLPNHTSSGILLTERTTQKYIFESFVEGNKIKYREIFTGFIATDEEEYFRLPYVVDPKPFIDYLPDTKDKKIPKLSLIWALNDINFSKSNNKLRQLKK